MSHFFASISDIFGGQSRSYQRQLNNLRKFALDSLLEKAKEKGANAILGISIDSDEISGAGKSMFMISVTGTAVKIRGIENQKKSMQKSIIEGDEVSRLLKLKEIEKRISDSDFKLGNDEIEMLIHSHIPNVAGFFMKSIYTIHEVASNFYEEDYKENISSLIIYLSQFEFHEQVDFFYPLISQYLILEDTVMLILNGLHLVDYKVLGEWFNTNPSDLEHFALKILKITKAEYTIQDVVTMKELVSILETKYDANFVSTDVTKWQCTCGKTNSVNNSCCSRCKKDIFGFEEGEVKPCEVVEILKTQIEIVSELLARSTT